MIPALLLGLFPLLALAQDAGERLYFTGTGEGGEITAYVGAQGFPVPASAVPCASCHGEDGLGRPEGGVRPSPITWGALTRPYQVTTATGRRRPPYDEATLARAITQGIDPAGNPLDPAMPRFAIPPGDLAALIAFLKRLEERRDPGVAEKALRLATVLPRGRLGETVEAVLRAFCAEAGEIGGRRLELVSRRVASPEAVPRTMASLAGEVFALLAPFLTGAEEAALQEARRHRLPLVTPFARHTPPNEEAFFLLSGWGIQARALVEAAAPPLLVLPEDKEEARAALAQARQKGLSLAQDLEGAGSVLFLGRDPLPLAQRLPPGTRLLLLGEQAGARLFRLPRDLEGRVFVAYPYLPGDGTLEGRRAFRAFLGRHGLAPGPGARLAFAAAKVVVAGLEGAGRALTRRRFKDALEALYRFETGVTPPVTFKGRRVGAFGAHVAAFDPVGRTLGEAHWVVP